MIAAERRGGRFYCGRRGCHAELRGLQDVGDHLRPSGWWDLADVDEITVLLRWRSVVGRRRIASRASAAVNDPPRVPLTVQLPAVVECPRCRARQRIDVAPPSD